MEWNKDSLAWLEVASGICFVALALCVGKANTLGTEPLPRLCGMEYRNCCCRVVLKGGRKAYNKTPTVTKWMCVWLCGLNLPIARCRYKQMPSFALYPEKGGGVLLDSKGGKLTDRKNVHFIF